MIDVFIDELTPCLKDTETGELIQTEVIQIKRKSFLKKFTKSNGWSTKWNKLVDSAEVYALVIKGTVDIQGLVALSASYPMNAVYVNWMCASPNNNKQIVDKPQYYGVGGHLFAIAVQKSNDFGFGGDLTGFAANKELLKHYIDVFNADFLGILHPYQFAITGENSQKIMEAYDYEWTDEAI